MKTLNEIGKRFAVLFVVSLLALALCMLAELCWRKLVAWLPYNSVSELLDRLQAHPVLFMVVILAVVSMIGAVASRRD